MLSQGLVCLRYCWGGNYVLPCSVSVCWIASMLLRSSECLPSSTMWFIGSRPTNCVTLQSCLHICCTQMRSRGRLALFHFMAVFCLGSSSGGWTYHIKLCLCHRYMWNKIISAFVDVRLKYFYVSKWKFAWNYVKVISEGYCNSWIFSNMFTVAEIIS